MSLCRNKTKENEPIICVWGMEIVIGIVTTYSMTNAIELNFMLFSVCVLRQAAANL